MRTPSRRHGIPVDQIGARRDHLWIDVGLISYLCSMPAQSADVATTPPFNHTKLSGRHGDVDRDAKKHWSNQNPDICFFTSIFEHTDVENFELINQIIIRQ